MALTAESSRNAVWRAKKKAEDPEAYKRYRNEENRQYRQRRQLTADGLLNGKIYCVRCSATDDLYVGSTILPLNVRLYHHKSHHRLGLGRGKLSNLMAEVGEEQLTIHLLEEHPCKSRTELLSKEREWIERLTPSLNSRLPNHSTKEWTAKKRLEGPTACPCGVSYSVGHEARHRRTPKHQAYVASAAASADPPADQPAEPEA